MQLAHALTLTPNEMKAWSQNFGDYIDVYDFSHVVEVGVTVPIYYESRLARIELSDAEVEELTEDEATTEQERIKKKLAAIEALARSKKRIHIVAADLVRHFEDRVGALKGKAMIVCMSRRICVALHDEIVALRPDWRIAGDAEAPGFEVS